MLTKQEIKDILLANGFTERLQHNGELDLNPYVYTAVDAVLQAYSDKVTKQTNDHFDKVMLSQGLAKIAYNNPDALPLALQIFNVEPCPMCDFVKSECKCGVICMPTNNTNKLPSLNNLDVYENFNDFPKQGKHDIHYLDNSTSEVFVWSQEQYLPIKTNAKQKLTKEIIIKALEVSNIVYKFVNDYYFNLKDSSANETALNDFVNRILTIVKE